MYVRVSLSHFRSIKLLEINPNLSYLTKLNSRIWLLRIYHKSELYYIFQFVVVACENYVLHRMNKGYRAWGALKSLLNNTVLRTNAKK